MHGFWGTPFFAGTKNPIARGLAVFWSRIHLIFEIQHTNSKVVGWYDSKYLHSNLVERNNSRQATRWCTTALGTMGPWTTELGTMGPSKMPNRSKNKVFTNARSSPRNMPTKKPGSMWSPALCSPANSGPAPAPTQAKAPAKEKYHKKPVKRPFTTAGDARVLKQLRLELNMFFI